MRSDRGGTIEDPVVLYSVVVPGVAVGHSAGFTWDGQVLVFGHESDGGSQPRCQATSSITNRTRGLIDWNLSDPAVAGALKLGHLNPQTSEFTLD